MKKLVTERLSKLNAQQRDAVTTVGKNIIISASAGTGKTFVLINRLIHRMLTENLEIDQVLVMTFTEAAARDLKNKLAKTLNEIIKENPDEEIRAFFLRQIAKLPAANISTIHSFCLDVIKKYGYVLQIDPESLGNVMSDGDKAVLQQEAQKALLRKLTACPELSEVLDGRPESFDTAVSTVMEIRDLMENCDDWPAFKQELAETYETLARNRIPDKLNPALASWFDLQVEQALNVNQKLAGFYHRYPTKKNAGEALISAFEDHLATMKQLAQRHEFSEVQTMAGRFFPKLMPSLDLDKDDPDKKEINGEYTRIKNRYKKTVGQITEFSFPLMYQSVRNSRDYLFTLIELAEYYRDTYQKLKNRNNLIDFQDMETMAIEILKKDDGRVARQYRDSFREVMIDEYQDSSLAQEKLSQLLVNGHDSFKVGDIKQSIYGFRNARPQIMQGLIASSGENDRVIHLSTNYRSGASIIDFSNYLFTILMNVPLPGTYQPSDDLVVCDDNKKVNEPINIVNLLRPEGTKRADRNLDICRYVSAQIREQVTSGQASYRDFTILVRNNKAKYWLKNTLGALNVPCHATYSEGFFNDPAVSTVISLLKLLFNPDDHIALLDVLRGPIYNITDQQIADRYLSAGSFIPESCDLEDFVQHLGELPDESLLVQEIYDKNDWYLNNVSLNQRDNLDALSQLINEFLTTNASLQNLLEYLKQQSFADKAEASSLSTLDDVVHILTIHQSKGLQAKYVYLLDFSPRKKAGRSPLAINEQLGMAMHYIELPLRLRYPNGCRTVIRHVNDMEDLEEEIRLLYVAVTRAEKQLNIVFSDDVDTDSLLNRGFLSEGASNYTAWILKVLQLHQNDHIRKLVNYQEVSSFRYQPATSGNRHRQPIEKYPETALISRQNAAPSQQEKQPLRALSFHPSNGINRGTMLHKAIEMLGIREVSLNDIRNLPLPLSNYDVNLLMAFYQNELTRKLWNYDVYNEQSFVMKSPEGYVNGIIDLLAIGEKNVYLIDFKSDVNVTEEILALRYGSQLAVYREAVRKGYPDKDIQVMIYSFYLNKYVKIIL